jgi:hypothetical protein
MMAPEQAKRKQPGAERTRAHPGWYHALTLRERLALLRREAGRLPELETGDATGAERALHAWHAQPPFDQETLWAERLALEGISEAELAVLLGERGETGWARLVEPPAWVDELEHVFAQPMAGADLAWFDEVLVPPSEGTAGPQSPDEARLPAQSFLPVLSPLLARGVARLQAGLAEILNGDATPPVDPAAAPRLFLPALARQLLQQATRTLTLELHVARLEGRLSGETPEERFGQFVTRLTDPEHLWPLLTEYAPLARLLIETLQRWVAFSLEVVQHLCTDWKEICRVLAPGEAPGTLCQVIAGIGDLHQGGKSTLILQFTSGWRLVYKPRSLAVDVHFQQLLADLNARGAQPPFRLLGVLDKGDHGWAEYVAPGSCTTREELSRFYERQGGYLALLYVLEATDFHYENLIAAGEHPMLVDLEALFHPRPEELASTAQARRHWETLAHSVLRVGLLPHGQESISVGWGDTPGK